MIKHTIFTWILWLLVVWQEASAIDYRKLKPEAWRGDTLNAAAMALYGREKFSTITKSNNIKLHVPTGIVEDRESISITIYSTIPAKTVAVFQDIGPESLIAVFSVPKQGIVEYELLVRMAYKGTLFAVVEGEDNRLYYTRAFVDILCLSCMAANE